MDTESVPDMYDEVFRCDDSYSVGIIRSWDRFLALRETWDSLVEQHGSHYPFLCHDWFRIWLKHFQGSADLLIIIVMRKDIPVLIAPLLNKVEKYKNVAEVKKLEFIGNHYSPIKCFIFGEKEVSERADSLQRLFRFFKMFFRDWDILELDSLPVETQPCNTLKDLAAVEGFLLREYVSYQNWYLDGIDYSAADYFARLPKKIRDELKRRKKRIEEFGVLSIEIGCNRENFSRYMDQYNAVRRLSWKNAEKNYEFLLEARQLMASRGWFRCGFIYLNNIPVAAQIRIIAQKTVYFLESLYDSHYDKFGLGNLLRSEFVRYCIDEEHVSAIDQGRGDEHYKEVWTPMNRNRIGYVFFNNTLKGFMFYVLAMYVVSIKRKFNSLMSKQDIFWKQNTKY